MLGNLVRAGQHNIESTPLVSKALASVLRARVHLDVFSPAYPGGGVSELDLPGKKGAGQWHDSWCKVKQDVNQGCEVLSSLLESAMAGQESPGGSHPAGWEEFMRWYDRFKESEVRSDYKGFVSRPSRSKVYPRRCASRFFWGCVHGDVSFSILY